MSATGVPLASAHLLGVESLSPGEATKLLGEAGRHADWLAGDAPKSDSLRGRVVVLGFLEPSTRTRVSFEIAGKRLAADTINLASVGSSLEKGESLLDTAWTLESMGVDALVLRHPQSGAPADIAARLEHLAVVNGGDGAHEHPTQALLDVLALLRRGVRIAGLRVALVGDIAYSRVARSNLYLLTALGAHVTVCGPPSLLPAGLETMARAPGTVSVTHALPEALAGAGAVIALRLQKERQEAGLIPSAEDYVRLYQITPERLQQHAPSALLLHPGPVNRGIEVDSRLVDGPSSLVREQVAAGVAVRCAVLERACRAGAWAESDGAVRVAADLRAVHAFAGGEGAR